MSFTTDASSAVYQRIVEFSYLINLSTREAMVLILTAGAGVHRKEAAHLLGCSPGTVDTYWRRILRKSKLGSQLELLAALLSFSVEDSTRSLSAEVAAPAVNGARGLNGVVWYRAAIDAAFRGNLALVGRLVSLSERAAENLASFARTREEKRGNHLGSVA